jgi:hypothetical protein
MPNMTHCSSQEAMTDSEFDGSSPYVIFTVIDPSPFAMTLYFYAPAGGAVHIEQPNYSLGTPDEIEFTQGSNLNVYWSENAVVSDAVIREVLSYMEMLRSVQNQDLPQNQNVLIDRVITYLGLAHQENQPTIATQLMEMSCCIVQTNEDGTQTAPDIEDEGVIGSITTVIYQLPNIGLDHPSLDGYDDFSPVFLPLSVDLNNATASSHYYSEESPAYDQFLSPRHSFFDYE